MKDKELIVKFLAKFDDYWQKDDNQGDGEQLYFQPFNTEYQQMYPSEMPFDKSWDWIMTVVEKIETLELPSYIDFHIMPDAVIVCHQDDEDNPLILINKSECKGTAEIEPTMFETKIQAVYDAVVILIKWYNLHIQHEQL